MSSNILPLKLRVKYFLFKNGLYAFIFLMIFGFAFILGKHIEAFFLFISYIAVRYLFPKTFHHPNAYMCVFWSIIAFWICIVATLPLRISILSSVVIAVLLCYILYKVQDYIDTRNELIEALGEFNLETCTRDQLLSRCRKVRLNKTNTEIAVAYFYDKSIDIWDIAINHRIEYESAKQKVWRIKKRLEK